ncbi:hypothetical protein EV182_005312 [Spiromyces aspiralis]|uniref:Uncharacterized protein n=1 Tax=Spiromyces aspiralis TaxID=68401 RepID=A0ACC1HP87_9FUNG|nr:hypothetical protein EV182_005312 [Spiromyces aspiralis]
MAPPARGHSKSLSRTSDEPASNADTFAVTTYPYDSFFSSPFDPLFDLIPSHLGRASTLGPRHRDNNNISASFWSPKLDISESDNAYHFCADLPGVNRDDVKLDINQGKLRIQGNRRHEAEREESGWHVRECSNGRFMRTVPLPDNVDTNNITAKSENGVLNITIPKANAQQARSIPIS